MSDIKSVLQEVIDIHNSFVENPKLELLSQKVKTIYPFDEWIVQIKEDGKTIVQQSHIIDDVMDNIHAEKYCCMRIIELAILSTGAYLRVS